MREVLPAIRLAEPLRSHVPNGPSRLGRVGWPTVGEVRVGEVLAVGTAGVTPRDEAAARPLRVRPVLQAVPLVTEVGLRADVGSGVHGVATVVAAVPSEVLAVPRVEGEGAATV